MKNFLKVFLLLLVTIIFVLVIEIFSGAYIRSWMTTVPILKNIKTLNNNFSVVVRESNTVRVTNNEDELRRAETVSSNAVSLVRGTNENFSILGYGLILSTDGSMVIISNTKVELTTDKILLSNGSFLNIKSFNTYSSGSTNLIFLETDGDNLRSTDLDNLSIQNINTEPVTLVGLDSANNLWYEPNNLQLNTLDGITFNLGGFISYKLQTFNFFETGGLVVNKENNKIYGLINSQGELVPSWFIKSIQANLKEISSVDLVEYYGTEVRLINKAESNLLLNKKYLNNLRVFDIKENSSIKSTELLKGDIITKVNGVDTINTQDIASLFISSYNKDLDLNLIRNGEEVNIAVKK